MSRRGLKVSAVVVLLIGIGLVVRNQVKVYRNRQRAAEEAQVAVRQRQTLFDLLRPVALSNCELERFGEPNDGGYLMCGNLLNGVKVLYSYGISGYDKWGCDLSTRLKVRLHQYDCFNTTEPSCPSGQPVFHAECVAETRKREEGRRFDTITRQLSKNGDRNKRLALKMDVEGAEWESLLQAPAETLQQIDQLVLEFHGVEDSKYLRVIRRLRRFFHVAHIHFNNFSCTPGLEPFPTWAYEVLFVNKRLGVLDTSKNSGGLQPPGGPHPLDARNHPGIDDCQP